MARPQKKPRGLLGGLVLTIIITAGITLTLTELVLPYLYRENSTRIQFQLNVMDYKLTGAMAVMESNVSLLDLYSKSLSSGKQIPKQASEAFETNLAMLAGLFQGKFGLSNLSGKPSSNNESLADRMHEANENAIRSIRLYCDQVSNQTASLHKQGTFLATAIQYKRSLEVGLPALIALLFLFLSGLKKKNPEKKA